MWSDILYVPLTHSFTRQCQRRFARDRTVTLIKKSLIWLIWGSSWSTPSSLWSRQKIFFFFLYYFSYLYPSSTNRLRQRQRRISWLQQGWIRACPSSGTVRAERRSLYQMYVRINKTIPSTPSLLGRISFWPTLLSQSSASIWAYLGLLEPS